jgi:hypothetical protein
VRPKALEEHAENWDLRHEDFKDSDLLNDVYSVMRRNAPFAHTDTPFPRTVRKEVELSWSPGTVVHSGRAIVLWLPLTMSYKIDPDVLGKVAKEVVGLPVEGGELISRATELLSAEYPDLIDATRDAGWAARRARFWARSGFSTSAPASTS